MSDERETANRSAWRRRPEAGSPYVLWLVSAWMAGVAACIVIAGVSALTLDITARALGRSEPIFGIDIIRVVEISLFFAAAAAAAHFLRQQVEQRAGSVQTVDLPDFIVARTGDPSDSRLDLVATARIELRVAESILAKKIAANPGAVMTALEKGLTVALNDPVTRFSKSKVEHVLRMAAGEAVPLEHLEAVLVLGMRQQRIRKDEVTPRYRRATEPAPESASPGEPAGPAKDC